MELLHLNNFYSYVAQKKPFLTDEQKAKKLAWCLQYIKKPPEFWQKLLITDEAGVHETSGRKTWFIRRPEESADPRFYVLMKQNEGHFACVYGGISSAGKTSLYFSSDDDERWDS